MNPKHLSIVTTLYCSEGHIQLFLERLTEVLCQVTSGDYEIIIVKDGSPDRSEAIVKDLMARIPNIKLISLSRNFGHHNALMAGMREASGEYVFIIDSDLETDPSVLAAFVSEMERDENDVIFGYQETRKGKWIERLGGWLFWAILRKLSDTDIPRNLITERLMTRRYVDHLVALDESSLFLAGMMHWVGFSQKGMPVVRKLRSQSSYNFTKRLDLMVNALTSFTAYPLKLVFRLGVCITFGSMSIVCYLVARKILFPDSLLLGYPSILASIFFSLGILMSSLGVIGVYLEKVYLQSKGRPLYVIANTYTNYE